MYKLIAIDLDGTLLNSYGEVSEQNREALKYAMNKGVQIVLASGRDPQTMKKISLELGIENYLIAGNGASVYDIKLEKNINIFELEKEPFVLSVPQGRLKKLIIVVFAAFFLLVFLPLSVTLNSGVLTKRPTKTTWFNILFLPSVRNNSIVLLFYKIAFLILYN